MTGAAPTIGDAHLEPAPQAASLRIAVVSDSTPERNGVGSYYADLVEQLDGRIARAELICPTDSGGRLQRYLAPPLPGDSTQRIWLPRPLKLWLEVSRIAPHAIVVPTPGPYGIAGLVVAKRLEVPLIAGFHTHYEALTDIYWTDRFGRLCRRYLTWCNRLLFRHSTLVLANSPEMTRQAVRMGAKSAELMGTSVSRDFLARPLAPLASEARRILFAGRLAEEKNVPQVIEVARRRPGLTISIAGDGPLRETVAEAAAELSNLRYLGWVSRRELLEAIDGHDLLLLPSRVESFGTVALEGMARGRPVIVSNACGIAEWPDLEAGLIRIGGDETATAAVDRVTALPFEEREAIGRRAHRAASCLNAWNLNTWIGRLDDSRKAHGHAH